MTKKATGESKKLPEKKEDLPLEEWNFENSKYGPKSGRERYCWAYEFARHSDWLKETYARDKQIKEGICENLSARMTGRFDGGNWHYTIKSPQLSVGSFKDIASFAAKLKLGADPVSAYLNDKLSSETRRLMDAYKVDKLAPRVTGKLISNGQRQLPRDLQTALTREIGEAIRNKGFYSKQNFHEIKEMPIETGELVKREAGLEGEELLRFNRLLLEDAYPEEISKYSAQFGCSGDGCRGIRLELPPRFPDIAYSKTGHTPVSRNFLVPKRRGNTADYEPGDCYQEIDWNDLDGIDWGGVATPEEMGKMGFWVSPDEPPQYYVPIYVDWRRTVPELKADFAKWIDKQPLKNRKKDVVGCYRDDLKALGALRLLIRYSTTKDAADHAALMTGGKEDANGNISGGKRVYTDPGGWTDAKNRAEKVLDRFRHWR
jgi:hypothetical protein